MYTVKNFKTKKALKEAVTAYTDFVSRKHLTAYPPEPVTIFQPGPFGGNVPTDGKVCLEGPHYPAPHSWYATATLKDGYVVKVS